MGENESRLVLHVQIAAELQGGNPLDRAHENRGCGKVIANWQFVACENRSASNRKLVVAPLALPDAPSRVGIDRITCAPGAGRAPFRGCPTDFLKPPMSLIVRHAHDAGEGESAGTSGKEEVLGHVNAS
jgi:hypothetical protein